MSKCSFVFLSAFAAALVHCGAAFADDPYVSTTGNHGTTGEQNYIDTKWTITRQTCVELDYALTENWDETAGESWYLFGGSGSTDWYAAFIAKDSNGKKYIGFNNGSGWKFIYPGSAGEADVRFTAVLDNYSGAASVSTNGVEAGHASTAAAASYESATLKIASSAFRAYFAPIKIYGLRIYEGGVKMRDYSPLVKVDVAGLYDSVTGKFLPGTGLTASDNTPVVEEDAYVATPANNSAYFIDTEYGATSNTCIMLDCALLTTVSSGTCCLFGSAGSSITHGKINSSSGFGVRTSAETTGIVAANVVNTVGDRRTYVLDAYNSLGYVMTDGETNGIAAIARSTESRTSKTAVSIKIASDWNGSSSWASLKVYGCKIYEEGVLVRDFIPCVRDGYPGLWDKLTGVFVSYPANKKREAAPVLTAGGSGLVVKADPYIEGSGTPYIVTDYRPCGTTRAEIDFAQARFDLDKPHYLFSIHATDVFFFGVYAFNTTQRYGYICKDDTPRWVYSGTTIPTNTLGRMTLVLDAKNKIFISAEGSVTNTTSTFQSDSCTKRSNAYLPIFATGGYGEASRMPMKLYSFRLFEDDVLVRDYVPAVKDGVAGLQDRLPGGQFLAPAVGSFTCGGAFPPLTAQSGSRVTYNNPVTLTAAPQGTIVTSYRWLKNGEPIAGGENGTLTVSWSKEPSVDTYQAIAQYTIDGYPVESEPSTAMTVEIRPRLGMMVIVR